MKVFSNGAYVGLDIKDTICIGSIVDARIVKLEALVSDYYNISVYELSNWQYDTEAKKMLCFLLYHHLHYSLGSLSKQYRIDRLFLRNCIRSIYIECLTDASKKLLVDDFINGLSVNKMKAININ